MSLNEVIWNCELPVTNWKFVLVAMWYDSDMYGFVTTDVRNISQLTGLSDSSVINALEGLKAKKIIRERINDGTEGFQINLEACQASVIKTSQNQS